MLKYKVFFIIYLIECLVTEITEKITTQPMSLACMLLHTFSDVLQKKYPLEQPKATKYRPASLITTIGVAVGVDLVIPINIGWTPVWLIHTYYILVCRKLMLCLNLSVTKM